MGSISEDKKDVISQMEYELVEKQDENGMPFSSCFSTSSYSI
jgi:hypothetical protein